MNDLPRQHYHLFERILNPHTGALRKALTYRIPWENKSVVDVKGQRQAEYIDITYPANTHIEEVRRSMNTWANTCMPLVDADRLWDSLGFHELREWRAV